MSQNKVEEVSDFICRRGAPPSFVRTALGSDYWVQVIGFSPVQWPNIRAVIEQRCGRVAEEARNEGCNWACVRFENAEDYNKCLQLDDTQWISGVWVHTCAISPNAVKVLLENQGRPTVYPTDVTDTQERVAKGRGESPGKTKSKAEYLDSLLPPEPTLEQQKGDEEIPLGMFASWYINPIIDRW